MEDAKAARRTVPSRRPVTCAETGETFRSVSSIARAMGVGPTSVSLSVRKGSTCCGLHFALAAEGSEAVPAEGSRTAARAVENGKYAGIRKAVMCVETGRVWPSRKAAAESLFVDRTTIASAVDRPERTTSGGLHLVSCGRLAEEARREGAEGRGQAPGEPPAGGGRMRGAA